MAQITTKEASQILGISKRTLYRWEIEGRIKSIREGILNVRIYDRDYIVMVKKLLTVNKQIDENTAKFPEIQKQSLQYQLEQVYYQGQSLKLLSDEEVEAANKAYENEKVWDTERTKLMTEFSQLLQDFRRSFPEAPLKELLLKEEKANEKT